MPPRPPVRRLVIPAAVRALHQARLFAETAAQEAGLDEEEREAFVLAITEAVSNAIRHGSPAGPDNEVELSIADEGRRLVATVSDQGPGFFPVIISLPDPMSYADHGRGLYLIHVLMDEVQFIRDGGTTVRMVKKKKRRRPKQGAGRVES